MLARTLAIIPIFVLAILPAQSQEGGTNAGVSAEADFRMYCAECHGEEGKGDGPKSFGLSAPSPDLTKLSARNGGTFPRERLVDVIDGRADIALHGGREMPVWGTWFKMEAAENLGGAEGDENSIKRRVDNLIAYIEELQE